MPSIGEEEDKIRRLKTRNRMYDLAQKNAEPENTPATGKMGNKRIQWKSSPDSLSKISQKRFKHS